MGQEELMQLPLPLPCTFPMLPCSPGRFHHLLLCWVFYWKSWVYVLHWAENLISFLASRKIVFRVRLELIWFLSVWTRGKPCKGVRSSLSHSTVSTIPFQAGIKNLRVVALSGKVQTNGSWVHSPFSLHVTCHIECTRVWDGHEPTSPGRGRRSDASA